MTNSIGRKLTTGLARQITRGITVPAQYFIPKTEFSYSRTVTQHEDEGAKGVSARTAGVITVNKKKNPSLSGYMELEQTGFLEWASSEEYTVAANADPSGVVFDHTFKGGIEASEVRLVTISLDDPTLADRTIPDSILSEYVLTMNTSERNAFSSTWVSKYAQAEAVTPVFNASPTNFAGKHVTVKIATAVSALAGAGAVNVKEAVVTRNMNVTDDDDIFNLGSEDVADHCATEYECEITIKKLLEDITYLDYMRNSEHYAVEITISDPTKTIGTAVNPTIVYTFPYVSFKSETSDDNPDRRMEDLTLMCHHGVDDVEASSYLWKSVTTNLVPTYEV